VRHARAPDAAEADEAYLRARLVVRGVIEAGMLCVSSVTTRCPSASTAPRPTSWSTARLVADGTPDMFWLIRRSAGEPMERTRCCCNFETISAQLATVLPSCAIGRMEAVGRARCLDAVIATNLPSASMIRLTLTMTDQVAAQLTRWHATIWSRGVLLAGWAEARMNPAPRPPVHRCASGKLPQSHFDATSLDSAAWMPA